MHLNAKALLLLAVALAAPVRTEAEFTKVKAEIAVALAAQNAGIRAGDCKAALEYWSENDVDTVLNGSVRPWSRDQMTAYCDEVMKGLPPVPDSDKPGVETIRVLSESSAYTITQYPDGRVVTRIWQKTGTIWRIVHVHESVAAPKGKPPVPSE